MGATENRSGPRARRRIRIRFTRDGKRWHSALTRDVGREGFFVLSVQTFPPGAPLRFEVDLPDRGTVRLEGRVAWARQLPPALARTMKGGFGVRLVDPPEAWGRFADAIAGGRVGYGASTGGGAPRPALPMTPTGRKG